MVSVHVCVREREKESPLEFRAKREREQEEEREGERERERAMFIEARQNIMRNYLCACVRVCGREGVRQNIERNVKERE